MAKGATFCDACGTPVTSRPRKSAAVKPAAKKTPARRSAANTQKKHESSTNKSRKRAPAKESKIDALEAENAARGKLNDVTFWVSGKPVQQGSMKAVGMAGRGLLVDTKAAELKKWRPSVAKAALAADVGYAPKETPIFIDVVFALKRPNSVAREMPCALIDLDKLCRAVGDSLSDVAYRDDRQTVAWNARKVYVKDEASQGALIRLGIWTPAKEGRKPLLTNADFSHIIKEGAFPKKFERLMNT